NELVRTKTLVKNCIVAVDAAPFKRWYAKHYGIDLDAGKKSAKTAAAAEKKGKKSAHAAAEKYDVNKASPKLQREWTRRRSSHKVEKAIADQLREGRVLARMTSRPGQSGRADGILLEGAELQFYLKRLEKKK
ncbi:putative Ribosomal protein S8e, partial [Leishmania utingensis]